jgi:hypothetical protein
MLREGEKTPITKMMDWVKRADDMIERYLMTVMKWVKRVNDMRERIHND